MCRASNLFIVFALSDRKRLNTDTAHALLQRGFLGVPSQTRIPTCTHMRQSVYNLEFVQKKP